MAILWCGGEDVDFQAGAAVSVDTTSTNRCSAYSRCALYPTTAAAMVKGTPFAGGAVTSAWLSCQAKITNPTTGQGGMIGLGRSGSTKGLFIGNGVSTAAKLTLYKYDGSS